MKRVLLVTLLAAGLFACKKAPETAAPTLSEEDKKLTPEQRVGKALFEKERKEWLQQESKDHAELVKPAPAAFKPADAEHKARFSLVLEKGKVKKGEAIRFRLEMQNLGKQSHIFSEGGGSLFKSGDFSITNMVRCYSKGPRGKEERLMAPQGEPQSARLKEFKLPSIPGASEEERFDRLKRDLKTSHDLTVNLAPGETLSSRAVPTGSGFRELETNVEFVYPGRYRLHCVYDNSPPHSPTKQEIEALEKKGFSREAQLAAHRKYESIFLGLVRTEPVNLEVLP